MKFLRQILLASSLSLFLSDSALFAAPTPGSWSGGVGLAGSLIAPDPTDVPVRFFEDGLCGGIVVTISAPSLQSPTGLYTGQVVLLSGSQVQTFRYSGNLSANGTISGQWPSSVKGAPSLSVTLAPSVMAPEAPYFVGEAVLLTQRYPIFILPQQFSAKTPLPLGIAGSFSQFIDDPYTAAGTGTGSAKITSAGGVTLAGSTTDGVKITRSTVVLSVGGKYFFVAPGALGKTGFWGGWASKRTSASDCDWDGFALQYPSNVSAARLFLAAYQPPSKGMSALPWTQGMLDLELGTDFFAANGALTFNGKSKFLANAFLTGENGSILNGANAWGVKLISLTLAPATGSVVGKIEYFYLSSYVSDAVRVTGVLSGLLNQKNGKILGRVQSDRNSALTGPFSVTPQ